MFRRWVAVTIIMHAGCAYAGAWVQPEGQGIFIQQATYYTANTYWDGNYQKQSQPRYSKLEYQPYVEYGALTWLTVGATAFTQAVNQTNHDNLGLADPQFFARANIWDEDGDVISLQPLVKLPSNFVDGGSSVRGGSKSFDAELALLYSHSFTILGVPMYSDTLTAYRARSNGLSDEWRQDSGFGINITDNFQLSTTVRSVVALYAKTGPQFNNSGDFDYDDVKAEIAGLYHLDTTQWVQATLFRDIAGIQTGDGYGLTLSYAKQF